ncbi:thiamine-phosphate pyrophosphorylase [Sphingomonas kaistensis]|uniref:Thiamine-phosphate pyrophosphorylase n=1 Tax=Sphingomonas kaistensis TaxID=298708 RepID=A0A7X6BGB8_9SPHN|nr:thiamine phosphate synthase [Sphingomonas kaistensis]NJC04867.1 thiamine-phosphate pyrophosphorylase [Sphingomonas kaistensis]
MTDERMGDALGAAIARAAAAGAGVIVRHHGAPAVERRRIANAVIASGALLGVSRDRDLAADVGAALVHNPEGDPGVLPFSLSVHDEGEARAAAHRSPALVFVSPLFATRSHAGAPALGEEAARRLALLTGRPAYALGGVDRNRGEKLMGDGWAGWAGIDAWL